MNDGAKERQQLGVNMKVYRKALLMSNPETMYQVLCWNCNCAKFSYGKCPHTKEYKK